MSVSGSDSKLTERVSGLYIACEGRSTEIRAREEDRACSVLKATLDKRVLLTKTEHRMQGRGAILTVRDLVI